MRRVVVPFLLAAVLTGCSSTEPGTPSAGGQTSTGTQTGTSAKSAPVNRPRAVDLLALDPCTLVTPETRTALGIRSVQPGTPDADYGEGSRGCGTSYEDRKFLWSIDTVVNGGADRLKRTVGQATGLTELEVAGYPAYLATGRSGNRTAQCEVFLDANEGQLLRVAVTAGLGNDSTADSACERAKPLAEAAGSALRAK
ncbi:DUF3558 domain-containing protein [Lentzea sp. NPDC042327]|uniref:DUF3558 domain-containing protein n=1 Tax=Lentzea sp. NPDC042327 TaxID=3154801 RepID=UPI003410212D